ncbi:MAG: glutamate--tRNA ligase [Verrucomicrobia bacterium]|nr:glutamate--tRNA ligase [Verrucomicrobiota bacterium]
MKPRVRFAPSPTGYLHIGGARTALFNWLYARHTGGTFILRVEDTDAARNTQEAVEATLRGLRWLGLDWDEGPISGDPAGPSIGDFGPYFQSQRGEIYRRRAEQLLETGQAYEHEGAIKFKMTHEPIVIHDLVVGTVTRDLTDRETLDPDFVIVRRDGKPVFHFVNVVDDLEMRITHVIRGEDHLSNTPKHIALVRALGAEPPQYAHIPLILNPNGSKMSKRDEGASLSTYQEGFFLPEAVLNYLCLLGWSPKTGAEVIPIEEVIARFDLGHVLRHNARFDMAKLQWLNSEHLRTASRERFESLVLRELAKAGVATEGYSREYVTAALATYRDKHQQLIDNLGAARFYFVERVEYDPVAAQKHLTRDVLPSLERLRTAFSRLEHFNAAALESGLKATATELQIKSVMLIHPVRVACTGQTIGPSLYHLMEVLGKQRVLRRLDEAARRIREAMNYASGA